MKVYIKGNKVISMKNILFMLLSLILLSLLGGCSSNEVAKKPKDEQVTVWYAPGTQKIRPDIEAREYKDIQMDKLQVRAGRFEYESAQIIMTPKTDIKSYELSVSDLILTTDSNIKFSSQNIEVFNQSYIECEKVFEGSDLTTPGLYPDALVPFDAAKGYGENTVPKGENQGLWVRFYVPEGQQAGEYTGTFSLDMDGYKQEIPVSVEVLDIDFAKNYTAESCFLIDWAGFSYAELDSSQDMMNAYAEALLDYRLQPDLIMIDYAKTSTDDMKYYASQAFQMAQDERCTVVFMPFAYDHTKGDTNLEEEAMKNWFRSFVDVSLESCGTEQQLNMVKKTKVYFTIIDEPFMNPGIIPRVNRITADFARIRTEVKNEYLEKLGKQQASGLSEEEYAFCLEVINDIDDISHVLTSHKDSGIEGVEIYCPQVHSYDSEEARDMYAEDKERWWYTCVGPHYPYPTYHIDDTNGLLSSRIMSWMQADYDVIGNLYWATNGYYKFNGNADNLLENPYTETAERFPGANGDGFLFYPGKKYGVNGPIGTIRLEAIRDGLEEYETLRAIEEIYAQINKKTTNIKVDFEKIYKRMSENLYIGTSVYTTQAYFDSASELLGNIAELANIGGAVSDIAIGQNESVVQLVLPKGCSVQYEGGASKVQELGEYDVYTFTQSMSKENKTFKCILAKADKEITIEFSISGFVYQYIAEQLVENISVGVRDMVQLTEKDYVSATKVEPTAEKADWLRLNLPKADGRVQHNMVISAPELFSNVGSNTQKMVIKLYNNSNQKMDNQGSVAYTIQFKYENEDYYSYVREAKLVSGYNEIVIGNVFAYNWEDTGNLKDVRILFGDANSEAENELYFIGIDVYSE